MLRGWSDDPAVRRERDRDRTRLASKVHVISIRSVHCGLCGAVVIDVDPRLVTPPPVKGAVVITRADADYKSFPVPPPPAVVELGCLLRRSWSRHSPCGLRKRERSDLQTRHRL